MLAGGWRPARMPRPDSRDLARPGGGVGGGRSLVPRYREDIQRECRYGSEMVTAFSEDGSAAALAMGGRRLHCLASRRGRLLARIAEKPDLTLRAIMAERAAAGVKVSYGALWGFSAR